MADLKKGWWKKNFGEYSGAFRSQCRQGLSSFKNPASLLARQGRKSRNATKRLRQGGTDWAQSMLKNPTKHEGIVGQILKEAGIGFMQQKAFPFQSKPQIRIVDFFIPDGFVAVEIDGSQHYTVDGQKKDVARAQQFKDEFPHVRFVRFSNFEVEAEGFRSRLIEEIRARGAEMTATGLYDS